MVAFGALGEVAAEAGKLAQAVRSVFNANAQAFMSLPTGGPDFSISEWIRKPDKPGSILFVTARYVDMALYKMLLTLWLVAARLRSCRALEHRTADRKRFGASASEGAPADAGLGAMDRHGPLASPVPRSG